MNDPNTILHKTTVQRHVREDGDYSGYLDALGDAWDALATQPITADTLTEAVCYALVHARLRSIAGSLHTSVVRRAVALEIWTRPFAMSLIELTLSIHVESRKPTEPEHADAHTLMDWLRHPPESPEQQESLAKRWYDRQMFGEQSSLEVATEVIDRVLAGKVERNDTSTLASVRFNLPDDLLPRLYEAVRRFERINPDLLTVLVFLAKREVAPLDEVVDAMAVQLRGQNRWFQMPRALEDLCPLLNEAQMRQLYEASMDNPLRRARIEIITLLAPFLPSVLRETALHYAVGMVLQLGEDDNAFSLMANLIPHLEGDLLDYAAKSLTSLPIDTRFNGGLDALAEVLPQLPPDIQPHFLNDEVCELALENAHEALLGGLLSMLNDAARKQLLAQAFDLPLEADTQRRSHHPVGPAALLALIPHLEEPTLRQRVIDAACEQTVQLANVGSGFEYIYSPVAEVAAQLAEYLEGEQRSRVMRRGVEGALALPFYHHLDSTPRRNVLGSLARNLPADIVRELLSAAFMPRSVWDEALLTTLSPYIDPGAVEDLLRGPIEQALHSTDRSTSGDFDLAKQIEAFAPHLTGKALRWALELTLTMRASFGGSYSRAQTLTALAPHLSPDLLHYTLDLLHMIDTDPDAWDQQCIAIRGDTNKPSHGDDMGWGDEYNDTCIVLAPYCTTPDLRDRMRAAITNIQQKLMMAEALAALLLNIPPEEQADVAEAVLDLILDPEHIAGEHHWHMNRREIKPMERVAPYLSPTMQARAVQELTLPRSDDAPARNRNEDVAVGYLIDLLPHLIGALREQAQDFAYQEYQVKESHWAEQVLVRLAPYLDPATCDAALTDIFEHARERDRQSLFRAVFPGLSAAGQSRLLNHLLGRSSGFTAHTVLKDKVGQLAPENVYQLTTFLLEIESDEGFSADVPPSPPNQQQRGILPRVARRETPQAPSQLYRALLLEEVLPIMPPDLVDMAHRELFRLLPSQRAKLLVLFAEQHIADPAARLAILKQALDDALDGKYSPSDTLSLITWTPDITAVAIERFAAIEKPLDRAQMLGHVLSLAADPSAVAEAMRAALFEHLRPTDIHRPTPSAFPVLKDRSLCVEPLFTADGLRRIAMTITAVNERWSWPIGQD